jgi:predicted nucleotidyltransferase
MNKHETFAEYPPRGLAAAETALLTIWPILNRYHDELVLVGGMALHYLTRRKAGGWPGAVTMDVDFGIALATEGGQYGTILSDLGGLGFKPGAESRNRLVREVEGMALYVDFLTEAPPAFSGSRMVDDVVASVVPGINRALESPRIVPVSGVDVYGAARTCDLAVADIGPLLVLKLNAFGGPTGRRHPKDAYDVLLAVTSFIDGPEAAVLAFRTEGQLGNPGYAAAIETLRRDFGAIEADAPIRAAQFLRGTVEYQARVREELVTAARYLLGD